MNIDDDEAFEQRLRILLKKTEDVVVPPLTRERLDSLRVMIPSSTPFLSVVWKQMVEGTSEALSLVQSSGLDFSAPVASVLRGGEREKDIPFVKTASLALPNGELRVQILPVGHRQAKLLLSVRGEYVKADDLSVELALGQRLIEARPLEQKVEFTLVGAGEFSITLFAGDAMIGRMNLNIDGARDHDNDG